MQYRTNMVLLRLSDAMMAGLGGHAKGEGQIWRSTLCTPFGEQQKVYHDLAAELGQDLVNGTAPPPTSMGEKLPFGKNVANLFALGKVMDLLKVSRHGVKEMDVVWLFVEKKHLFTRHVAALPGYEGILVFSQTLNPAKIQKLREQIVSCVNVIRLPIRYRDGWHQTLIPNPANADEADVARSLENFYEFTMPRIAQPAAQLSAEDYANLKATMPLGMSPLFDYLICKLAPDLHVGLGITEGRAEGLVRRFDDLCEVAKAARREAIVHVEGRFVKATGKIVKDLKRAVDYACRRTLKDLGLLREAAQAASAQSKSLLGRYGDIKEVLHDIARATLPSYKLNDNTPVDAILLGRIFGSAGGQVDHFHRALDAYMTTNHGKTVSRSATASLMHEVGIRSLANIHVLPMVLSMHYCAASVKMMVQIFGLFSLWSLRLSIDAKSLYKCNCSQGEGRQFQLTSERALWGKPDHDAGNDSLGKLGLFSIWLMGKSPSFFITTEGLPEAAAEIPGYDKAECFGERVPFAAAFGHVEDEQKETAPRNMHDVDRFLTKFTEYCLDPTGAVAPFILFELDNAHGPADLAFCFCLGLLFFLRELGVAAGVSPAGKCSATCSVEKLNGALSRALRRAPIMLDSVAPQSVAPSVKMELLVEALSQLVRQADGATFNGGGGHVRVVAAREVGTAFEWRSEEIAAFLAAVPAAKATFVGAPMGELKDPAVLYRKVFKYLNVSSGPTQLFFSTKHSCIWRTREGHPECHAPRGPAAMYKLLDMFGGFLPRSMVPSARPETPTSYMRLAEMICERGWVNKLAPDAHYPDTLFKGRWPEIELAWGPAGPLPGALMASLVDTCRAEKHIVEHAIKYKLSLGSHRTSSAALKLKLVAAGTWDLALQYVAANSSNGKNTGDEIKDLLRKKFKFKASTLNGLHVADLVEKVVASAGIETPRASTVPDEIRRGHVAEAAAAALAAAAAASAVSQLEADAVTYALNAAVELDDAGADGDDDDAADGAAAADDAATADDAADGYAGTPAADAPPPLKRTRREGLRAPTTRTHRLERAHSCITR